MAKPLKPGNPMTTIAVSKIDKNKLRLLAKFIKETKNGKLYESDSQVFTRVINEAINVPDKYLVGNPTYPSKNQDESQQDSSPSDTTKV